MKTFWNKYKSAIIVILLFAGTIAYYRDMVSALRRELFDNRIEHILEMDRMIGDIIREQVGKTDSLIFMERRRYDSLATLHDQSKKSYEKISADYSSIIIDRPEF